MKLVIKVLNMKRLIIFLTIAIPSLTYGQNIDNDVISFSEYYSLDEFSRVMLYELNPCQDETYLELKEKGIDNLSDREFEIFKVKDLACTRYQESQRREEVEQQNAETLEKASNTYSTILIISAVVSAISLIYLLSV
jgi:hypothetical protein